MTLAISDGVDMVGCMICRESIGTVRVGAVGYKCFQVGLNCKVSKRTWPSRLTIGLLRATGYVQSVPVSVRQFYQI